MYLSYCFDLNRLTDLSESVQTFGTSFCSASMISYWPPVHPPRVMYRGHKNEKPVTLSRWYRDFLRALYPNDLYSQTVYDFQEILYLPGELCLEKIWTNSNKFCCPTSNTITGCLNLFLIHLFLMSSSISHLPLGLFHMMKTLLAFK